MKTDPPLRACPGFTLIETLVALSIIAIVLLAVYRLQATNASLAMRSRFYTLAPLLADQKLVEIKMADPNRLSHASGDFGESFPGYTWEFTITEPKSSILGATAQRLKRIDGVIGFNNMQWVYEFRIYLFL